MCAQAVIDGSVLCVHGGLSPDVRTLDQIRMIDRVCEIPHEGPFCDLMWSDPEDIDSWAVSPRGAGELAGTVSGSSCCSAAVRAWLHMPSARGAPQFVRLMVQLAAGWLFGGKVATEFNTVNGLELICRAHQLVQARAGPNVHARPRACRGSSLTASLSCLPTAGGPQVHVPGQVAGDGVVSPQLLLPLRQCGFDTVL